MNESETDLLIVGAGPIGIEMAIAAKRAGIAYLHVEAENVGSTIQWYAPQTHFFSSPERIEIAGVPLQTLDQTKATREEYLAYLRAVVLQFALDVRTGERVVGIRSAGQRFAVTTRHLSGERSYSCRRIVLAIGDMHRPRVIGAPGEDLPHVDHYFREPHRYFGRRVLIVGGRNSAVEAAIRCVRAGARSVTLSYRGETLDPDHIKAWLMPELRNMIASGRIVFLGSSVVCAIGPGGARLQGAAGVDREIETDAILLLTGYEQDSSLFEAAGIELEGDSRRPRLDPTTMESSVPGIYVAGTAIAGTQASGVKEFIETSHVHVERIIAALSGSRSAAREPSYELPES